MKSIASLIKQSSMERIWGPKPRNRLIIETSGKNSLLNILLGLLISAVCLGGDVFCDIFSVKNFIICYVYFTLFSLFLLVLLIRKRNIRLVNAVVPLAVFMGVNLISLFWSPRLRDAQIVIVPFATGFLTFLITPNMIREEKDIYFFLRLIVVATTFHASFGILQAIFGYQFITSYGFAAHGTTYNPNAFSSFLGMVYPIAILLYLKEKKNLWLLPVLIIFFANLCSISRVGILTVCLVSIIALSFSLRKGYKHCGFKLLAIIFLAVSAYLFSVFLREKVYPSTTSSEISLQRGPIVDTAVNRTKIWQGTLPILSNHLFGGGGLRSFQDLFKHFNNPFVVWPRPHAHNLFLHIASEVGILGVLFFILFISSVLLSSIRNYRNAQNPQLKMTSFFFLLSISGFLFSNLTEYNWEHPLFQVLFYFLASLILLLRGSLNPDRSQFSIPMTRVYRIAILGLLTIFWVIYVGNPWVANYYLLEAKTLLLQKNEKGIHCLLKASSLDPSNPEPHSLLFQIYRAAWSDTKEQPLFEKAIHAQQMVIRSFPMEADSYLDLAQFYEDSNRMKEAQFQYEKAIDVNPYTPKYQLELASFLERNKDTKRAVTAWEALKDFLEKYEPKGLDLLKVYFHLATAYGEIGNLELSKKYLNSVVNFPENGVENEPADSPKRKIYAYYRKVSGEELLRHNQK